MSVYKAVCLGMCACVYLHLCEYIFFIFNLVKKLHQKPSRGGTS